MKQKKLEMKKKQEQMKVNQETQPTLPSFEDTSGTSNMGINPTNTINEQNNQQEPQIEISKNVSNEITKEEAPIVEPVIEDNFNFEEERENIMKQKKMDSRETIAIRKERNRE